MAVTAARVWRWLPALPLRLLRPAVPGLRLQTRLALFGAALVLAGVGLTAAPGWWLIDRQAERAARERLAAAAEFAVADYEHLIESARITAEVLAARLPPDAARTGLSPEEAAALEAIVHSPRRVEAADSIALIAPDGTVVVEVARDRGLSGGGPWPGDEAVAAALRGRTALGVDVFPGGGLRAVAVLPVRPSGAEGVAAVIAVTSFIDDEVANRIRRVTGFDVAFFAGTQIVAVSRPVPEPARRRALQAHLEWAWARLAGGEDAEAEIGGPLRHTLVHYAPLRDTSGDVLGAVAVSAGIDVLGARRRETLALFAGAVGLVLVLTLIFNAYASRVLSRPLARLVEAVRRIGAGDLVTPVVAGDGDPTARQQDEVAELAASIEEMRARLAAAAESQTQLNRLKDQYLFSVAHELRSPLAALAASVDVLVEAGDDLSAEERARFVAIVRRHTVALRSLVENLLDLGSLRAGRFQVEPRPIDVETVVAEAIAEVAPHLEARRQRVTSRIPRPAPVVQADPRRLRQVLVNLLSNAAKYGPEGEEIEVAVEPRDGAVRFSVADHGPGIPPEEQARLFDAYFRSEATSRAAPGVGLGLAIVKAIVDAHGGAAGVESAPGAGARFWVELPAAGGAVPATEAAGEAALRSGAGGASSSIMRGVPV